MDMTTDDIFQKLHVAFPFVHLCREDAAGAPELCRLLLQLSKHVDESGLSRSVSAELAAERQRLAQTVISYHSSRMTQTLLEEMATQSASTTSSDDVLRAAVSECLSLAELHSCSALTPDTSTASAGERLLGLSGEDLTPSAQSAQTLARLPRALDQRLTGVARQYTTAANIDTDDAADSPAEQLSKLPTRLEELARSRQLLSNQLQQLTVRRDQQLLKQSMLISQQLNMLLELINKHRLEHRVDLERKTIDLLTNNVQGMLLKIKLLQLEIECATYTDQCLAALRAAGRHVRSSAARQDAQLARARQQLTAYQTAGQEFSTLAQRYQQLSREAEHQRWLIREMERLGTGDVSGET